MRRKQAERSLRESQEMNRRILQTTPDSILVLDLAIFAIAAACVVTGAIGAYEWLLIALLARPMLAFVLVLESFERPR